jgi:hypothetical protein
MIQRIQTLLLFFSSLVIIIIVYSDNFPIYQKEVDLYFLTDHEFLYARLCLVFSAALSVLAIFQFKNRKRQLLLSGFARFLITISFALIVFLYGNVGERDFSLGTLLLIIPFIFLVVANFFIKKDEKLVKSADRIR